MLLEGQVAIVTGGGQGIGKAIALRLAAEGADIGIIDVNGKKAEATRKEIRDLNRRAVATAADVANFQAVEAAMNEIVGALGRLDVLVNNAGIEKRAPFLDITRRLATTTGRESIGNVLLQPGGGTRDGKTEVRKNREPVFGGRPHRSH